MSREADPECSAPKSQIHTFAFAWVTNDKKSQTIRIKPLKVSRRTDRLYEAIIARVIPASLPGERLGAAAPQTDLAAQRFLFILFLLSGRRTARRSRGRTGTR